LPSWNLDTDKNKTRLKSVFRLLVQCNRVAESEVDEILRQHSKYAATEQLTTAEIAVYIVYNSVL